MGGAGRGARGLCPCTATPTRSSIDIELERTPDGQLMVPVVIDGKPPAPFIVDTGASATVISPEVVTVMGLQANTGPSTEVVSAAGRHAGGPSYALHHVTVGGRDFGDLQATSTSLEEISTPNFPIAGILGQDFLAGLILDVDFPLHHLRIRGAAEASQPPASGGIPFRRLESGLLVIDVRLDDGDPFPAVIDLGAQASILNTAELNEDASQRVHGERPTGAAPRPWEPTGPPSR